jgi:phosphoribosylaminoimidazolecarboxamide formyltransferase/IMP cyclohydrolase
MMDLIPIRRALISVSDKTDLVPFARALAESGVSIISTGGTAAALSAAGVRVTPVEQVTGFPEIMDGRVKTLHPSIHGGLLGRRDVPAHAAAMRQHGIEPIDLVCVSLYPFERTILAPGVTREQAIEQIDIGGPAMIRSAAKNHDCVTVVTAREQYDRVINELRDHEGSTTLELRRDLAAAAFTRTAAYDTAISAWMSTRREEAFPALLRLAYAHAFDLRYGENPHQAAAAYRNPASAEPSVISATLLRGKALSYNNLLDGAAALELIQDLGETFPGIASAAIIKHANPCGAALAVGAGGPAEAFERAYQGDPRAAYGGILALSVAVEDATARTICDGQRFLEVIIAPAFSEGSVRMLGERWRDVRLLATGSLAHTGQRKINYRSVPGGMLVQERDMRLPEMRSWQHVAGPAPSEALLRDAALAWVVAKHLKSNAIAIAAGGRLAGAGMGQVDRVTACRLAVERMQAFGRPAESDSGAAPVAASDAFFPFPDGPELLIGVGVKCIVHPGGSKRDQETIDLCQSRGVTLLLTGVRHFRH